MAQPKESFIRRYPLTSIVLTIVVLVILLLGIGLFGALTATPGKPGQFAKSGEEIVRSRQAHLTGADKWQKFVSTVTLANQTLRASWDKIGKPTGPNSLPDPPDGWPTGGTWPPDPSLVGSAEETPMQVEAVRLIIADMESAGVIRGLAELTPPAPAVRPLPAIKMIEILLPELGFSRGVARLNHGRMVLALRDGRYEEFAAAAEQSMAIARIVGSQVTLIDRLVGVAITALVMKDIREAIRAGRLDEATLGAVQAAMDRQLPLSPMSFSLDGERLMAMDTVEWTHSTDGRVMPRAMAELSSLSGSRWSASEDWRLGGMENLAGYVMPSKQGSIEVIDEFYRLAHERAKLPAREWGTVPTIETFVESLSPRFMVPRLILPAIGKAMTSDEQGLNDVAATRIMIALERHRLATGAYPASLAELVPKFIEKVPEDRFAAGGFVYKVRDAGAKTAAEAYSLYSMGLDGKDDGGVSDGKDMFKAYRNEGAGNDVPFVVPAGAEKGEK